MLVPRIETVVDIDETTRPCCRSQFHGIVKDVSEQRDVIPAPFRVLVIRRPKYACRICEEDVAQAPSPARLIDGGLPTEALAAHVLVARFTDHCPLCRQAHGPTP